MSFISRLFALFKKDFRLALSYKGPFIFQFFGGIFQILLFFFISDYINILSEENSTSAEDNYFTYVVLGICFVEVVSTMVRATPMELSNLKNSGVLEEIMQLPSGNIILLFGSTINIFSQIALVVLIGIATKNSILIVDWANQLRVKGKGVEAAIVESCKRRFRPIMMTSLSTLIAMVPLIVGNIGPGAGEGIRLAVGCTIFGGMLISTFLTLFTTPVFYLLLCKNSKRMDEVEIQLNKEFSK